MSDHHDTHHQHGTYFVPEHSSRPITAAIGLLFLGVGSIMLTESPNTGLVLFGIGAVIMLITLFFWFRDVIVENRKGLHDAQMDRTYRWGMFWYAIVQIMLFMAFFGGMIFIRAETLPGLGGHLDDAFKVTHLLLWPNFTAQWPLMVNPSQDEFMGPQSMVNAWGWPAINLVIIFLVSLFMWSAQSALKKMKSAKLNISVVLAFVLGIVFSVIQTASVYHATSVHGITSGSGIYGSLFIMMNFLVLLNAVVSVIVLLFVMPRCFLGHFDKKNNFAVDAVSYMWYLVGFFWLTTFLFVYLL
jgi:cytochrome c oxidase subunit 3